jgi:hypothetical protein
MRFLIRFILISFLLGFLYHLSSLIIHFSGLFLNTDHNTIHILSALGSLILFFICSYLCKRGKTYDEDHHKINKIR